MSKKYTFAFAGNDEFCSVIQIFIENGWELKAVLPLSCECRKLAAIGDNNAVLNMGSEITPTVAEELVRMGTELLLVSGYPRKIPQSAFSRLKTVNIHPSYLPFGRGSWPQPSIIYGNIAAAGVTFHKVDRNFDTGNILLRESIFVDKGDNLHTFMFKQAMLAEVMASDLAKNFIDLWKNGKEQEPFNKEEAATVPRAISWDMEVVEIDRIVRSLGQFGAFATINNTSMLVFNASVWKQKHKRKVGSLVFDWGCGPLVAASDGYVFVSDFEPK